MEGRMLGISAPSLPILMLITDAATLHPWQAQLTAFVLFFSGQFPLWSNGCKLLVAVILDHGGLVAYSTNI